MTRQRRVPKLMWLRRGKSDRKRSEATDTGRSFGDRATPVPGYLRSQHPQSSQGALSLGDTAAVAPPGTLPHPQPPNRRNRLKFLTQWQLWIVLTALVFSGSGFLSMTLLLQLPDLSSCSAIFWPLASASVRLYCAQEAAESGTAAGLLRAIALVNILDSDHPLRGEVDRQIQKWAAALLELAEDTFHEGDLEEAIAIVRKIPTHIPSLDLSATIDDKVGAWEATWSKAEKIYQQAENALRQQDWRQAFQQAVLLSTVGNRYWETTRYDELTYSIQATREDAGRIGEAKSLAEGGTADNLLEAIKLLQKIRSKSFLYEEAQTELASLGRRMLELAEAALEQQDLTESLRIARMIPETLKLSEEVKDFTRLARAESLTWDGTVSGYQEAIAAAQKIASSSPMYGKAQERVDRWQLTIADLGVLDRARGVAASGNISALNSAIAEAQLISSGNPLWEEAQAQIDSWNREIQLAEDRPILEQAREIARRGDVGSLQDAINQAGQFGENHPLYPEAREDIRSWQAQIERTQDDPLLDRARQYANQGDLAAAIATAEQIQPGRALYDEAQSAISNWRGSLQGQQSMDGAYEVASSGSAEDLIEAIRIANQVPGSSSRRAEADNAINRWSQQVLGIAREMSDYDLPGAIAIARRIPGYAPAYDEAQQLVASWEERQEAANRQGDPGFVPSEIDLIPPDR